MYDNNSGSMREGAREGLQCVESQNRIADGNSSYVDTKPL